MKNKYMPNLTIVFMLAGAIPSAYADIEVFTDRMSWENAVGDVPEIFEDFNDIAEDTPLPFSDGGLTLAATEASSFIDAEPFLMPSDGTEDDYVVDGTTYFRAQTEILRPGVEIVMVSFGRHVISWGVDLNPHSSDLGDKISFQTSTGETGTWILPLSDTTEFRGFIADVPFTSVIFFFNTDSFGSFAESGWDNVAAHLAFPGPPISIPRPVGPFVPIPSPAPP